MLSENRIVHGLWIGPLSRLELLALHTFVEHGHEFHLWQYEPARERLPDGVVVEDAAAILPRAAVFRKRRRDDETGLGMGSYATFSDLFRTKLLFERGGIWADLDIVCLRPFDFAAPYVFRDHRVGAVMNVIKCPPRSALMRKVLARAQGVDGNWDWLAFTRIFADEIQANGLAAYVRDDLMPPDRWDSIKPYLESDATPQSGWYGIHFMTGLWAELQRTGGWYKGKKIAQRVPDKNHPVPGTTLFRWYDAHRLIRSGWSAVAPPRALLAEPAATALTCMPAGGPLHLNEAIYSMTLGGAERAVAEVLSGLAAAGDTSTVFLLRDVSPAYDVDAIPGCRVVRLHGRGDEAWRSIGLDVLCSGSPVVFAHLIAAGDLDKIAAAGARVVPVIQNAMPAWSSSPAALNAAAVPFVVAVSEAVRRELIDYGCTKPVIVLRHELQRSAPSPDAAARDRHTVRRRHEIPDDALLIGMVGQFKAQKAYARAVKVLAAIREYLPARLMIVGGWDHAWGAGREAYVAACREALDSGVMADLILPGSVHPVDPYYSAFDVFLNTSSYEGLSVSMLEAIRFGCPVVTARAGGNDEAVGPNDRVIDGDRTDDYVDAILEVAGVKNRVLPAAQPDADVVPRLWALTGRYGTYAPRHDAPPTELARILFVTENLNVGGAQRSLTNLLVATTEFFRATVLALDANATGTYANELTSAGITTAALPAGASLSERCRHVMSLCERLNAGTLVFWNVPAALKLMCAKVFELAAVRIVDVSPGPAYDRELEEARAFGRRVSFSIEQYRARLDHFVTKHAISVPPGIRPERMHVIPNGVPLAPAAAAGPRAGAASSPVIGTACRIVPAKRLDVLVDMMEILETRLPQVRLEIAGAADPAHRDYAAYVADKVARAGLRNIAFTGPLRDLDAFVSPLYAFVMASDDQGCPNASLEAMARGVPVIANASGGTHEQVVNGITGVLLGDDSAAGFADAVERLVRDPALRDALGRAAQARARESFSMDAMTDAYLHILLDTGAPAKPRAANAVTA